jgi:D-alanyl-D-alanine dipeptidase
VVDVGGRADNYLSDITRMAFIGEPSTAYLEVHAVVAAATRAGIDAAVPGASCADVDNAARTVIEDAGYGKYFVHRTGHGLGVSAHESPWIMQGNKTVLVPGNVFSIEPGIYLPGEFGVRIEDTVYMNQTGATAFSALSHDVHLVA